MTNNSDYQNLFNANACLSISSPGRSAMMEYGDKIGEVGMVFANAVIGGTVEALGGGKFANGAVTGAYVMMFNHLMMQNISDNEPQEKKYPTNEEFEKQLAESFKSRILDNIDNLKLYGNLPEYWAELLADEFLTMVLEASDASYGGIPIVMKVGIFDGVLTNVAVQGLTVLYENYIYNESVSTDWDKVKIPRTLNPGIDDVIIIYGPNNTTIGINIMYEYLESQ